MAQNVLITGGNKGIGLAVTDLFVQHDYNVIVLGRDFSQFPYKDNKHVKEIVVDLSDPAEVRDVLAYIGLVHIVINNAGINGDTSYDTYTDASRDKVLQVNLHTPIEIIRHFAPFWIERRQGRVVNVASQAAEVGHSDIWYGITKAGLVNVTKSLASALGPKGIVINAVSPGPVDTSMLGQFSVGERITKLIDRTYLHRLATPQEVATVIYWLAVKSPAYINGENIDINNGAQRI